MACEGHGVCGACTFEPHPCNSTAPIQGGSQTREIDPKPCKQTRVERACLTSNLHRSLAYYRCEVCHFKYKFVRTDLASVLAHPASVAAVFVLLLLVLTTLLGYIPLVQSLLRCVGRWGVEVWR